MHDYLLELLKNKQQEIDGLKKQLEKTENKLLVEIYNGYKKRDSKKSFKKALTSDSVAVIAEIKRKSPSKGRLNEIADPTVLARQYVAGGADAISVLTDRFGFNGSTADLQDVVHALADTSCVVLRKDFILDAIQIAESIALGADAILLIVAALKEKTADLLNTAKQMGIDALVEVENREELDYAVSIGADVIGINNRDLTTFVVDTDKAKRLVKYLPASVIKVAESGIHSVDEAIEFLRLGFDALLIGEALVKAKNPTVFIEELKQCTQHQ